MRRRLDLAASIVAYPEVLFLDEPTTGLDPRSRTDLWGVLRTLAADGTTIVLTTQYLDEADQLADDIVVLDHGSVVAQGTPRELKAQIGKDRIDVKLSKAARSCAGGESIRPLTSKTPSVDKTALTVTAAVNDGTRLIDIVRALEDAGVDPARHQPPRSVTRRRFLTLTTPAGTPRRSPHDDHR